MTTAFSLILLTASSSRVQVRTAVEMLEENSKLRVEARSVGLARLPITVCHPVPTSSTSLDEVEILRRLGIDSIEKDEKLLLSESKERAEQFNDVRAWAIKRSFQQSLPEGRTFLDQSLWSERLRSHYTLFHAGVQVTSPQAESVQGHYLDEQLLASLSNQIHDLLPGRSHTVVKGNLALSKFSDAQVRSTFIGVGREYRNIGDGPNAWRSYGDDALIASLASRFAYTLIPAENTCKAYGFFIDDRGMVLTSVYRNVTLEFEVDEGALTRIPKKSHGALETAKAILPTVGTRMSVKHLQSSGTPASPSFIMAFEAELGQVLADEMSLSVVLLLSDEQATFLAQQTARPFDFRTVLRKLVTSYGVSVEFTADALLLKGGSFEFLDRVTGSRDAQTAWMVAGREQNHEAFIKAVRVLRSSDLQSSSARAAYELGFASRPQGSFPRSSSFPSTALVALVQARRNPLSLTSLSRSDALAPINLMCEKLAFKDITGQDSIPALQYILGKPPTKNSASLSLDESSDFALRFAGQSNGVFFWADGLAGSSVALARGTGMLPSEWVTKQSFDIVIQPASVLKLRCGETVLELDRLRFGKGEERSNVPFGELPPEVQKDALETLKFYEAEWNKQDVSTP